jgi:hypothetical protein
VVAKHGLMKKATGGWKKLYAAEFHDLYSSHIIINMMKARGMRRARHVARVKEMTNSYEMLMG